MMSDFLAYSADVVHVYSIRCCFPLVSPFPPISPSPFPLLDLSLFCQLFSQKSVRLEGEGIGWVELGFFVLIFRTGE